MGSFKPTRQGCREGMNVGGDGRHFIFILLNHTADEPNVLHLQWHSTYMTPLFFLINVAQKLLSVSMNNFFEKVLESPEVRVISTVTFRCTNSRIIYGLRSHCMVDFRLPPSGERCSIPHPATGYDTD